MTTESSDAGYDDENEDEDSSVQYTDLEASVFACGLKHYERALTVALWRATSLTTHNEYGHRAKSFIVEFMRALTPENYEDGD